MNGKRRVEERAVLMEFRKNRKRTEKSYSRTELGLNHPTVQNLSLDNPIPCTRLYNVVSQEGMGEIRHKCDDVTADFCGSSFCEQHYVSLPAKAELATST